MHIAEILLDVTQNNKYTVFSLYLPLLFSKTSIMKKAFILWLLSIVAFATTMQAQTLYVGEFNIRNTNEKDTKAGNGWVRRCPVVCNIFRIENFDVFGAQEVYHSQLEDLCEALPQYGYVGVGRDDGKQAGEYAPIFYKKDRIKCLSSGAFWLSETPEVAGSKGWDAKYPRICTWGQFKDLKSGKKFWMFNLHLDHKGVEARKQSCHLVLAKVKEMCGNQPYILMGDFNVDQKNEIYGILADSGVFHDSFETAAVRFAETGSMNYFKINYKTDLRIDHVFLSPKLKALDYVVLTYSYWTEVEPGVHEQRLPSDHYPVGVHVMF